MSSGNPSETRFPSSRRESSVPPGLGGIARCRCRAVLVMVAISSAHLDGGVAVAQDVDKGGKAAPVRLAPRGPVKITDRQFDRWVFLNEMDSDMARQLAEARLSSRIAFVDLICGISPEQRRKLEVAGRGEIKAFFDDLAQLRAKVRSAGKDVEELDRLGVEVRRQAMSYLQLGSLDSRFSKVLRATIDREQSDRYRERWDEVRLLRYQSRVEWVCLTLQKNHDFSVGERFRLVVVMLEETRPLRVFGPGDYYGVMCQAARIPEQRIRPIFFQDADWRALQAEFDDARRRERFLRDSGCLPEDPPAGHAARAEAPRDGGGHVGVQSGAVGNTDPANDHPSAREKRAS